jgi:quercetin dioxygenase-like cupin family protein
MLVKHLPEIPSDEIVMPGMTGVATQGVLMEHPLLPGFLVRMFALAPEGHTGLHQHPQQHLHYVVEGEGFFVGEGGGREALRTGDVVLTEPNEFHQMVNASSSDVMRFFDVAGPFQPG